MAHSASAKKRVRQNATCRARNRWRKRGFREAIAQYHETILHGSLEQAESELTALYKTLDRTAAKGVIKKNAASRYKSRLTAKLNTKKASATAA